MKIQELTIPKPCDESWDAMRGDAKERFCDSCQHEVHDLSAMTQREAEALLASNNGSLCVRYAMRGQELVFQPEPSPHLMAQLRGLNSLVAAAALVIPLLIGGCDMDAGPEPLAQPPIVIQEGQPLQLQAEPGAAKPPAPPVEQPVEQPAEPAPVEQPIIHMMGGLTAPVPEPEEAPVKERAKRVGSDEKEEAARVDTLHHTMGSVAAPAPEAEEPCDKGEKGDQIKDVLARDAAKPKDIKMGKFQASPRVHAQPESE